MVFLPACSRNGIWAGASPPCSTSVSPAFLDSVKTEVDYQRGDRGGPENARGRHLWRPVPELQVMPSLMWYPLEGIQLQFAYDFFCFFNTVASPQPVDFNYSSLTPQYTDIARFFNGFQATIAFIF